MKRKVLKIGPATLVVSLPAQWTKKFNIKKGDELQLTEYEKSLQVTTNSKISLKNKTIDISRYNPLIMRTLGMLYKAGFSEIKIFYDDSLKSYRGKEYNELKLIKRAVDSYSGMDIKEIKKEKDSNYILLVERAELLPNEFKNTLNQAFYHLSLISEEVLEAIRKNNCNLGEKINLTDNLINQATNFCQKILNTRGYEEYSKTCFVYQVVVGIEEIGDKFRLMYDYFKEKNIKLSEKISEYFIEISGLIEELHALYRAFDKKKLTAFAGKCIKIMDSLDVVLGKCKKYDLKILIFLENITERVYDLLEPIIAINHEKLE